jgi:hypothetical protein
MARVVAFVDDLIFQAKLVETVRQLSVELKLVTSDDARAAGWSEVLTRSNFVRDLATILETAKSEQP